MKTLHYLSIICLFYLCSITLNAQNETSKWYFGGYTGLDFMTTPPTVLSGSISTQFSSVSMADASGNLLFYSNGLTVWNKNHQIMANGTGLAAGASITGQNAVLAVKQPGPGQLYYVFTGDHYGPNNYSYSIIDMTLAAGMGSVTTKNALLWDTSPFADAARLAAVAHCNGTDMWITCHSFSTTIFHSYLLSSSGLSTSPVISNVGDILIGVGALKFGSNGKKLAMVTYTSSSPLATSTINVHDFDNSTGQVSSNFISIGNAPPVLSGMEFSPDGTKIYSSGGGFPAAQGAPRFAYQWDLCAGTESVINASKTSFSAVPNPTVPGTSSYWYMQVAPDGKIYMIINNNNQYMALINQPNLAGAACGFSLQGFNFAPAGGAGEAFPNFPSSYFRNLGASPETTIICQQVQFNVPNHAQVGNGCAATNYPILSTLWDFGDNASSNNISTSANPIHYYTSVGTYTAQVIIQYNCRADTFKKVINIVNANPNFSITGTSTVCVGETSTLSCSASSAYTYSWSTGAVSPSVVITASANTNYTVIATGTNNCSTNKLIQYVVKKCTGFNELENTNRITLYPNPTKETIWIETNTKVSVSIFNNIGELILQKENVENRQEISLSQFPAGLYFVKLSNGDWTDVKPLIKE